MLLVEIGGLRTRKRAMPFFTSDPSRLDRMPFVRSLFLGYSLFPEF
jgi:hypothetical protein